jgi:hypothetical protein
VRAELVPTIAIIILETTSIKSNMDVALIEGTDKDVRASHDQISKFKLISSAEQFHKIRTMNNQLIQFIALFLLMLVTGIFWGPWFSLHRSIKVFSKEEFAHIVKTMAANLAVPMRFLMPTCVFFMFLSVWIYPEKNSLGFYLNLLAFGLILISLLVTVLVEVPIVNRIIQWNAAAIPSDWEMLRNRWVKFHVVRTFAALAAFACFGIVIVCCRL